MAMSVVDIIEKYTQGRMSSRPEYYSGRGNNPGDLDSSTLQNIYEGIEAQVGAEAAKAFVNMVGEMTEDASATTFLVSLYRLERNEWKFEPRVVPAASGEALSEAVSDARRKHGDEAAMTAGMAGIFSLLAGSDTREKMPDAGLKITYQFLSRHKVELNKDLPQESWAYDRKGAHFYKRHQIVRLVDSLDNVIKGGLVTLIPWVKKYTENACHVEEGYKADLVLQKLADAGYRVNEYTGKNFVKGDKEILGRYIVGQVMSCMEGEGLSSKRRPLISFCEEYIAMPFGKQPSATLQRNVPTVPKLTFDKKN